MLCERCGSEFSTHAQFKTSGEDWSEMYTIGQRIEDDDPLARGGRFEACVARYCGSCRREWQFTLAEVKYEVLADWVTAGTLSISQIRGSEPLTREDVLLKRQQILEELRALPGDTLLGEYWPLHGAVATWRGHVLGHVRAQADLDHERAFLASLYSVIDERLRRWGWKGGSEHSRELIVEIGADQRIEVTDPACGAARRPQP
ncbi:MAG: hypothetical protein HY814_12350 [Candidatus Riflebacteria bacterium]|nr:hypothetical protein [Candidatus Riflebacteria bacterium]